LIVKVHNGMILESQMAQQFSIKIFSRNIYITWGALKSKKTPKSIQISFYRGKMTPLNWSLRFDIETPHWHDTRESDGKLIFSKNLLQQHLYNLRLFKEWKNTKIDSSLNLQRPNDTLKLIAKGWFWKSTLAWY